MKTDTTLPNREIVYPSVPEGSEPESMYWEGEDGEGYKEDGLAVLVAD